MEMENNWDGTLSAAIDSVNLLNAGKPEYQSPEDWAACVKRNVEHLKIQVAKDWPEGYNLAPLNAAIAAND
jgi:hypothetical protein